MKAKKKIIWGDYKHPHHDTPDFEESEDGDGFIAPTVTLKRYSLANDENFHFFIMHTNFNLTPKIEEILNEHDGVETLNIISPYRARIAIGEAFDIHEVQSTIESILCAEPEDLKQLLLYEKLNEKYLYWCVYKRENGLINTFGSSNENTFLDQIKTVDKKNIVKVKYGNE